MRDNTKLAIGIVAALILVGSLLYWRFSPYEQCVRAQTEENYENWQSTNTSPDLQAKAERSAKIVCAQNSN